MITFLQRKIIRKPKLKNIFGDIAYKLSYIPYYCIGSHNVFILFRKVYIYIFFLRAV